MQTVVALFESRAAAERAVRRLPLLGQGYGECHMLESPGAVRARMDCSQRHSVLRGAALGAVLLFPIMALVAIGDAHQALSFGIDRDWVIAAAIGFTLFGSGCGALMGSLVGRSQVEEQAHLYLEGVRRGGVLVMALVSPHVASTAMNILRQQNGLGVQLCTRSRVIPPAVVEINHRGQEHPLPR